MKLFHVYQTEFFFGMKRVGSEDKIQRSIVYIQLVNTESRSVEFRRQKQIWQHFM